MCGRYVIARSVNDLLIDVGAVAGAPLRDVDPQQTRENWNVAPSCDVPVVLERVTDDAEPPGTVLRELHVARWGLIPGWAKDPAIGNRAFNARSETVLEKPMFRAAIRHRRCAVPANGYYEWKKRLGQDGKPVKATDSTPERPAKQPYFVHPTDQSRTMWFAGIYEWWKDPGNTWILSCSILTTQAPSSGQASAPGAGSGVGVTKVADIGPGETVVAELADLHDRMPIALQPETLGDWLDPRADTKDQAGWLVERVRGEAEAVARNWQLRAVGPEVGNVRSNHSGLVDPVASLF